MFTKLGTFNYFYEYAYGFCFSPVRKDLTIFLMIIPYMKFLNWLYLFMSNRDSLPSSLIKWNFEVDYSNSQSSNNRGKAPGREANLFVFLHIPLPHIQPPLFYTVSERRFSSQFTFSWLYCFPLSHSLWSYLESPSKHDQ